MVKIFEIYRAKIETCLRFKADRMTVSGNIGVSVHKSI